MSRHEVTPLFRDLIGAVLLFGEVFLIVYLLLSLPGGTS